VQVAAVDHCVHVARQGRRERPLEAGEEVVAPAAALHARPRGEVEAEVGVRDEEDPHADRHAH